MAEAPKNTREFESLLRIITALRGPGGCPWDLQQTHATLARFAIEEAFELSEAIDTGQTTEIRDELGDVLFQVVLHAEIARQNGTFTLADVIQAVSEKMIRRHPHVFGDVAVTDADEVLRNWSAIKEREKAARPDRDPHDFDIPAALPALLRAHKIGEKTAARDFDWDTADQCWEKVREELGELTEARVEGHGLAREEAELGDLLFSLAQWARHRGLDAERALRRTNQSFEARYRRMRAAAAHDGHEFKSLSSAAKESYWSRAKPAANCDGSSS